MREYICQNCGRTFSCRPRIKKAPKYCSPECFHSSRIKPISENGTYVCSMCKQEKPVSMFHKRNNRPSGLSPQCKECFSKFYDKDKWRDRRIKREYKANPDKYNELYKAQDGRCAVCGCKEGENGRGKLALDHDHNTFVVRGLLCFRCNTAIAAFEKIGINKVLDYLGVEHVSLPK